MKLYITGEINGENFGIFSRDLSIVEGDYSVADALILEVELCSSGGLPEAAMAYASRIRDSTLNVNIRAYGGVESAAVLVLAAGDHRIMDRHARVMVHETSVEDFSGTVSQLEKRAAQLRASETQWNELMAFMTHTSAEKWAVLHKEETILTPEECLKLGLIDEIA